MLMGEKELETRGIELGKRNVGSGDDREGKSREKNHSMRGIRKRWKEMTLTRSVSTLTTPASMLACASSVSLPSTLTTCVSIVICATPASMWICATCVSMLTTRVSMLTTRVSMLICASSVSLLVCASSALTTLLSSTVPPFLLHCFPPSLVFRSFPFCLPLSNHFAPFLSLTFVFRNREKIQN